MPNVTKFKDMAQVIDDTRVTDPVGPPSARTPVSATVTEAHIKDGGGGNGDGSGNMDVGDTTLGNKSNVENSGSGVTPSLNGASDVVSDFDYYKNKLEQDGTGALVRNKYESQVKQTATESARYVAENISKGNQSFEQNAYVAAQTADKLGWSGGYALDAARQVEYLRASIQADIFSQQELQKLGYKSNLEAAYASAELELNEQAQNNYYQAQQMAINQAQVTGQYIDPAIADMCIQAAAASNIMNKQGIDKTSAEYQKAQKVYDYMVANLKARGGYAEKDGQITPVAIQTLADIQMEMEKLNFEQAKIQVLNSIEESGGVAFPVIGDDGQIISWTSSPSAAINENLAKFYQSQPNAFDSKVNELMTNMVTGYQSWLQMKDGDGNLINDGKSFNDFLTTAYKNPNALTDLLNLVNPSTESYTQGDLTVTKDNDGKWTIGGTGTTSNNGGDGDTTKAVTDILSDQTLTEKGKLEKIKEKLSPENVSAEKTTLALLLQNQDLTDKQKKDIIELDKNRHGELRPVAGDNIRFIAGGMVNIKNAYNEDGSCTISFMPKFANNGHCVSADEIGEQLQGKKYPKGTVSLDDFKVNGQPIVYNDRLYVWSDASGKFLLANSTAEVNVLIEGLRYSFYDLGKKTQE